MPDAWRELTAHVPRWLVIAILCMIVTGLQGFLRRRLVLWGTSGQGNDKSFAQSSAIMAGTVNVVFATAFLVFADAFVLGPREIALLLIASGFGAVAIHTGRMSSVLLASRVPLGTSEPIVRAGVPILVIALTMLLLQGASSPYAPRGNIDESIVSMVALPVAIALVSYQAKSGAKLHVRLDGAFLLLAIICGAAAAPFLQKPVVSAGIHPAAYIFVANCIAIGVTLPGFLIGRIRNKDHRVSRQKGLVAGTIEGLLAYGGLFLFLHAIKHGPLAMVVAVTSGGIAITVLLERYLSKTRIGTMRWLGIFLAIAAVAAVPL